MMIWTQAGPQQGQPTLPQAQRFEWDHAATGAISSTRVATSFGWRQIADLRQGEMVLTFDAGMQPLRHIERSDLRRDMDSADPSHWPLSVPAGALGNSADMIIMPGQSVLVESALSERLMGERFVLIRAADLDSVAGISRVAPSGSASMVTLGFADDQVVFAAGGALLYCEGPGDLVGSRARGMMHAYRALTSAEADLVLSQDIMPLGAGARAPSLA